MLIPKGGNVYTRLGLHELRVRPEGPGPDGGRRPEAEHHRHHYIPPVVGAEEGAQKLRPVRCEQSADLPLDRRRSRRFTIFDAMALNNEKYLTQWQNLISG